MEGWTIRTIVLGYDGSEGAERATRLASALALQNKARVLVVVAFHWTYSLDAMGGQLRQEMREAEAVAEKAVSRLRTEGIEAAGEVADGAPGEVILRTAETHGADLIVVGRRGRSLTASLLLGSTSEYVVRRATVPVLVAH